jgi:hypothetical protein
MRVAIKPIMLTILIMRVEIVVMHGVTMIRKGMVKMTRTLIHRRYTRARGGNNMLRARIGTQHCVRIGIGRTTRRGWRVGGGGGGRGGGGSEDGGRGEDYPALPLEG